MSRCTLCEWFSIQQQHTVKFVTFLISWQLFIWQLHCGISLFFHYSLAKKK